MRINATSNFASSNVSSNNISRSGSVNTVSKVKEVNKTVKDFKDVVGKEDFNRIIDNVKDITTDLKYTRFEFSIHDDTKRVMVKIYDRASDELITEIPPEKMLDLLAGIWKQAGLIVDEKV